MKVVNRHHLRGAWPEGHVYIGRPGKLADAILAASPECLDGTALGNPYNPKNFPDPAECLVKYRKHLWKEIGISRASTMYVLAAIRALENPVLVCSCAPRPCHGDVIAEDWRFIIDALDEWQGDR